MSEVSREDRLSKALRISSERPHEKGRRMAGKVEKPRVKGARAARGAQKAQGRGRSPAHSIIRFKAKLLRPAVPGKPVDWNFLIVPREASAQLPSRGMVSIEGTIHGASFQATLEPDGEGSHWLRVERELRDAAGVKAGDVVSLELAPVAEEPEPTVPADLQQALVNGLPRAQEVWLDITPVARRD